MKSSFYALHREGMEWGGGQREVGQKASSLRSAPACMIATKKIAQFNKVKWMTTFFLKFCLCIRINYIVYVITVYVKGM